MKCLIQHEPLVVDAFGAHTWDAPLPLRDHFALVSITHGDGTFLAEDYRIPYQAGTCLLLGPADCYDFEVAQPTRFIRFRFTDDYLASVTASGPRAAAWQRLRHAARHAALGRAGVLQLDDATPRLQVLLNMLAAEYHHRQPDFDSLARSLMGAVLSVVGRQVAEPLLPAAPATLTYAASVVHRLLAYIRSHIADSRRLRIEELGSNFAYSPGGLSKLFRQETGESLRQYIVRHRLQLAESQLKLSTRTVSQIADELGFVDVCHFSKMFKKRYHLTPTDYRRQLLAAPTTQPAQAYAYRS